MAFQQPAFGAAPPGFEGARHQGKTLRAWFLAFEDFSSSESREQAGQALERSRRNDDDFLHVAGLLLRDQDPQVRSGVLRFLAMARADVPRSRLPAVRRILRSDPDAEARKQAADVLAQRAKGDPALVADLESAVKQDRSPEVRSSILYAFRTEIPSSALSKRTIVQALHDADAGVRMQAGCLFFSERLLASHAAALRKSIRNERDDQVLLVLGEAAGVVADEFVRLCSGEVGEGRPVERARFALALGHCSAGLYGKLSVPEETVAVVTELLNAREREARYLAVRALSLLRSKRLGTLKALARSLTTDPDASVRAHAGIALSEAGPACVAVMPALLRALSDKDPAVRGNAALAISEGGHRDKATTRALLAALKDPAVEVRWVIVDAIGACCPPSPEVFAALKPLRPSENKELRRRTERAIKRLESSAPSKE